LGVKFCTNFWPKNFFRNFFRNFFSYFFPGRTFIKLCQIVEILCDVEEGEIGKSSSMHSVTNPIKKRRSRFLQRKNQNRSNQVWLISRKRQKKLFLTTSFNLCNTEFIKYRIYLTGVNYYKYYIMDEITIFV